MTPLGPLVCSACKRTIDVPQPCPDLALCMEDMCDAIHIPTHCDECHPIVVEEDGTLVRW